MDPMPALPNQPMMPIAANAAKKSAPAMLMPPMPRNGQAPPSAPPAAPQSSPATAPSPMPPGMPLFPPPSAPAEPPYKMKPQADGTIAVVYPAPDGSDVVGQVYPAPRIPRAFQAPKGPQQ